MTIDSRVMINNTFVNGYRIHTNGKYYFVDENGKSHTDYKNYKLFKDCNEVEKNGLRLAGYIFEDRNYNYIHGRREQTEKHTPWIVRSHK